MTHLRGAQFALRDAKETKNKQTVTNRPQFAALICDIERVEEDIRYIKAHVDAIATGRQ